MIENSNFAFRYFDFLEKNKNSTWLEIYKEIQNSEYFGIPEVLTLLEPYWYVHLGINLKLNDPRGNLSFKKANENAYCTSKQFWGYDCPFTNSKVHVDHVFPYSRGGSTHHSNATYLCEEHNIMKFTDIHILPWNDFVKKNNWIRLNLERMVKFSQRLAGEKLFPLEKQLERL